MKVVKSFSVSYNEGYKPLTRDEFLNRYKNTLLVVKACQCYEDANKSHKAVKAVEGARVYGDDGSIGVYYADTGNLSSAVVKVARQIGDISALYADFNDQIVDILTMIVYENGTFTIMNGNHKLIDFGVHNGLAYSINLEESDINGLMLFKFDTNEGIKFGELTFADIDDYRYVQFSANYAYTFANIGSGNTRGGFRGYTDSTFIVTHNNIHGYMRNIAFKPQLVKSEGTFPANTRYRNLRDVEVETTDGSIESRASINEFVASEGNYNLDDGNTALVYVDDNFDVIIVAANGQQLTNKAEQLYNRAQSTLSTIQVLKGLIPEVETTFPKI